MRKNISLHRLHHSWFLFCVSGNAATLWEADRSWGRVGFDNSTDPASSHNSSRKLQEPIQPPAWKFQWSPLTLTLYSTLWHTNVLFSTYEKNHLSSLTGGSPTTSVGFPIRQMQVCPRWAGNYPKIAIEIGKMMRTHIFFNTLFETYEYIDSLDVCNPLCLIC